MTTKFCPLHDMCTVTYLHYNNLQCIQCFWSRSRKSQNLWTGHFSQGQNLWKTLWNGSLPGSYMHLTISPPPKKIQCWSLISATALASEQHWSIHLLGEGRGHRRISVLWVRKYKTYFVQDSIATYAILKIITEGIFSWKAWLNETIDTFSSHMKQDKINCIPIEDGLLNLKDLEILTSVVSDFK